MKAREIRAEVFELAERVLAGTEVRLVDVDYRKDHGNWYLTLVIDKAGGVGFTECEKVSSLVGEQLDLLDLIPGKYFLEVSSPGVFRSFESEREYEIFAGRLVKVKTYAPVHDAKEFIGKLVGLQDDQVVLDDDGQVIEIAKTQLYSEL